MRSLITRNALSAVDARLSWLASTSPPERNLRTASSALGTCMPRNVQPVLNPSQVLEAANTFPLKIASGTRAASPAHDARPRWLEKDSFPRRLIFFAVNVTVTCELIVDSSSILHIPFCTFKLHQSSIRPFQARVVSWRSFLCILS